MYESFFGLQEKPFSISPDPRFFFLSSQHKEALFKSEYAASERMGLSVVYGDIGTGKTTIARRLHQLFSDTPNYRVAMIISPNFRTENALLREIMKEFGVETKKSFADSLGLFRAFLLSEYAAKRHVILMLDEAQTVRSANFELIRHLLNFETDSQKLLNIILLGQTELAHKLDARPELKSRVTIFAALTSLSPTDAESMIRFRWHVAGGKEPPLTKDGLEAVFRLSKGLPRQVCTLLDNALATAFVNGKKSVDKAAVHAAAMQLRLAENQGEVR